MSRVVSKIGSSTLAHVHLRGTREGKVTPACGAYKGAKFQCELIVTSNVVRVKCPACLAMLARCA